MQHLDVGQIRQTHLEHIVVLALFDARGRGLSEESYITIAEVEKDYNRVHITKDTMDENED